MRIIYIYQNKLNHKIYVGQTKNLKEREYHHKYEAFSRNSNYPLYNSIRKYGLENFNILELEIIEDNDADDAERFWIEFFRSWDRNFGYNLESGGCANKIISTETRRKMSKTRSDNFISGKTIPSMFGKHHTEETKQKISNANNGKCHNTPEHMNKIHKISAEKRKGKPLSEETKNKIAVSHYGFKHSEESRKKMSKTRIERGTFAKENNPMFGITSDKNPNSKLTWDIVNNIRTDYFNGLKGKKLYTKYNISETHMYRIIKNEIWQLVAKDD